MLNLRKRDIPSVKFRRELPDFLADGKPCFIDIEARAAGPINIAYFEGMERVALNANVMDRAVGRIKDDDDQFVSQNNRNMKTVILSRFGVLYDACVIEWKTNILDGDKPVESTRENFMALCEAKIPEIANAISDFELACLEAGETTEKEDGETVKN